MNLKHLINKKSQHEAMGFVLIVLLVTIIGLGFIVLSVGNKKTSMNSIEVSNLLQSAMYYTTDCASDYYPRYRQVEDLIKECNSANVKKCKDGRTACDALKTSLKQAIDISLKPSETSTYRAYNLTAYYKTNKNEPNKLILNFGNGIFTNCSSRSGGQHLIGLGTSYSAGSINVELVVCKSK